MSRSLNKVQLIGNLGADPEVRATPNGGRVAQFSLATSRTWNDQNGVRQEKTDWHRCVAWNTKGSQLADLVERYVRKGEKLYVEGRVEYRQWQDKDGQTRYATEINVRELILLGARRESQDADEDAAASFAARRAAPAGAPGPVGAPGTAGGDPRRGANGGRGDAGHDDFTEFPDALDGEEDDLPF